MALDRRSGTVTARHPWRTIAVWVVILAVAGWQASMIGNRTTSDFKFNTKPESVKGFDLIEQHMGGKQPLTETVVVPSDTLTVDDAEFQNAVTATTTALRGMPGPGHERGQLLRAQSVGRPERAGPGQGRWCRPTSTQR